jgi:lipid A 3-O-deacylase
MHRTDICLALAVCGAATLVECHAACGSDIDALRSLHTSSEADSGPSFDLDSMRAEWCAFAFDPTMIDAGALEPAAASGGASRFGAAGSWRWQVLGGGGIGTDSIANGQLGAGVSWFVVDDLSVDVQVNADYFSQSGPSAWGGDVELLFRWHFIARDTWSIYVDGGCGLMWTSRDVPPDSASFNFTPQAGAGISYEVATDTRLMVGARWFHASNANTASPNPSYNGVFAYVGLSFGF